MNGSLKVVAMAVLLSVGAMRAEAQGSSSEHNHAGGGAKPILLAKDLEMRLAENALPKMLREGATLMVLQDGGYVVARKGTNTFTCIVSRRGGNFYPVCFDEEGAKTILPAFADDAVLRLKGMSDAEVEAKMAQGFADGRYRPPSRPGIAYMLSAATYMAGADGKLGKAPPHTMFYAPYLTDEQIGGSMGRTAFVDRPGPHGMIIVVAGAKEREGIAAESQALVEEVERAIGLKQ